MSNNKIATPDEIDAYYAARPMSTTKRPDDKWLLDFANGVILACVKKLREGCQHAPKPTAHGSLVEMAAYEVRDVLEAYVSDNKLETA